MMGSDVSDRGLQAFIERARKVFLSTADSCTHAC